MIFFAIQGTFGFMFFVLEESMQTMMFASFNYKEMKDCSGMKEHLKLMQGNQKFASFVINGFGILSPIMWLPYHNYLKANESYIKSIEKWVRVCPSKESVQRK